MKKRKKPEFKITLKETGTFHLFELPTKSVDEKSEMAARAKAENDAFQMVRCTIILINKNLDDHSCFSCFCYYSCLIVSK